MTVIKIWTVTTVGKDVKKHTLLMHPTSYVAGGMSNGTKKPVYKTEIDSQIQKTNLRLPWRKGG